MNITIKNTDVVWSYLSIALSMAVNFLLLPFYMYYMSSEVLGMWYIFISIGAFALLFDFGFSVTFSRNITYCWSGAEKLYENKVDTKWDGEPNFRLLKKVLSACKLIYGAIATIAFILLLTAGTQYVATVGISIVGINLYTGWVIYSVAIFLNLYYSYYLSFLRGIGAVKDASKAVVYARVLQLISAILLLMAGFGIIGAAVGYLMYGLGFKVFAKKLFYQYNYQYKQLGEHLVNIENAITTLEIRLTLRTIWYNAWRDGVVALANYLSTQATVILCSFYITLKETGEYSIDMQLYTAIAVMGTTFFYTYQPSMQEAYVNRNIECLRTIFSKSLVMYTLLYVAGTVGLFTIGKTLLQWVKPEALLSSQTLLLVGLAQYIIYFRNCYTSYFSATNRIIYVKSFLITAVGGLCLSLLLLKFTEIGISGIIVPQILSQAVFNLWYWPYKANKEMNLTMGQLFLLGVKNFAQKFSE